MLGSVIRQMKLKFPFLNCRKTYESVCPEHCSSHSPAKLPERGQHPTTPTNLFHRAAVLLCQQFLYHLWGNPREETEENPTLGCPMLSLCALGQPCWARQSWGFRGLMPCQGSQAVQGSATRAGLIRQIWAAQGFRRKGRRGKQPGAGRCGLGRDEVSDVLCCSYTFQHLALAFSGSSGPCSSCSGQTGSSGFGQRWFCSDQAGGSLAPALTILAPLVSPFSSCRSSCAVVGAGRVLGRGRLTHQGSRVLQASPESNYSLVGSGSSFQSSDVSFLSVDVPVRIQLSLWSRSSWIHDFDGAFCTSKGGKANRLEIFI